MIILQKFGFKESRYERPQDTWICGRLAEGDPCELGPGSDGRCCVTTTCQPRLEKDRWQCRRTASAGGPCERGPLPDGHCCISLEPCVPRRSLRSKRKRAAIAAAALVVGILAIVLGGKEGRHFMMPGKLSSHHAGLTDCSSCHSGAQSGQVDLLHRLMTSVEPRQNSNLCLTCHLMGTEPFAPHTHPVADLERRTEKLRLASKNWQTEGMMQRIVFPATVKSRGADAEIQCATCHKEHQGVFANMKAVSNQRCQTCHVSRFGSFADSHPQFDKFPYLRRPRIAFDHQSHMSKYFPDAVKAAIPGQVALSNCADCHQVGVRQRYMEVKPFATICAGCHNGDITGATQVSGPKGIDVLAVPGLDVATLDQRGIDIGSWPERSEATLTPFMKLLLKSDGDVVSGAAGLDLLDLRKASDQDLARVAALAWAVKRLFLRLETTNPPNAKLLAGEAFQVQIDQPQLVALTGGLSHDVIMAANREWFPDLLEELQRHDRGEPTHELKSVKKPSSDAPQPPSALTPNPGGAEAKSSGDDILGSKANGKTDDILGSDSNPAASKDDIPSKDGKNDKADILAAPRQDDILASKQDDILAPGNKPANDNVLSGAASKGDGNKTADAKKTAEVATPFDPEIWAQTGGWYRQDFTIRYRPAGHADQFMQTWLDVAGRAYRTSPHDQMARIFDMLSAKDAVGRCTKCHSIDDEAGAKLVRWLPFDPNAIKNRFTNFSHKPHVELIGARTCVKCHKLQADKTEFMKTYESGDPVNYTPSFKPLDKAICSSCHSQQTAWENCTLCHGYHVLDANTKSSVQALQEVLGGPTDSVANSAKSPADRDAPEQPASAAPDGSLASREPTAAASRETRPMTPEPSQLVAAEKPSETAAEKPSPQPQPADSVAPDQSVKAAMPDKLASVPNESSVKAPELSKDQPIGAEPVDIEGFLRRGHDRAVRGEFELARHDFDEVIRRDPKHAAALDDRCWVLAILDEVQDALADCNASLRAAPNFADALDSRGLVNLKLGLYKKSVSDYTAALSQFRGVKRAAALYGRGIAKRRSGNVAGAKLDLDAARAIRPSIADQFASYGIR
jgi:hypothetical protein